MLLKFIIIGTKRLFLGTKKASKQAKKLLVETSKRAALIEEAMS